MQNTAFLVIAADPCERGPFNNVVVCTQNFLRTKDKGTTFPFFVHSCHVNVPWLAIFQ